MDDPLIRSTDERLARLAARRTDRPAPTIRPESTPPGRRRHPAVGARRSALALSVTTTLGLAAYLHHADAGSASASELGVAPISGSASTVATTGGSTTSDAGVAETTTAETTRAVETTAAVESTAAVETTAVVETTAAAAETASSASLADGAFTGDTFTNKWGPVQVAITVTDGSITSIDVLQYPADDRKSVRINQRALPTLIEETLVAQSAEVDTVSGATYTTDGYRQSLQSAIDDARAALVAS